MAKRLTKRQSDGARSAIQTGRIIQLLQDFIQGKGDLSTGQITAAKILLGKTVPDLAAVELRDTTGLDTFNRDQLVNRLVALAKDRPELQAQLGRAFGGTAEKDITPLVEIRETNTTINGLKLDG